MPLKINKIEVAVDQVDIPQPLINYLLSRLNLESFKKFPDQYNKILKEYGTYDRETILKKIQEKYKPALTLPILLDKHIGVICPSCGMQLKKKSTCSHCGSAFKKEERYWIRDGCHRFLILVACEKKTKIKAQLYYDGMEFPEWDDYLYSLK